MDEKPSRCGAVRAVRRRSRESLAQFPHPRPDPTPAPSGITATRSASSAPPRPTPSWSTARTGRCSTLTGTDRQTWLHSISTQHVSDLPDGASTQNLSLDGQGRVEDHWIQTELGGVTYLDTEPWRGEPLLAYLRKMVFWSDVDRRTGRPGGAVAARPAAGRPAGARRARRGRAAGRVDGGRAARRRLPAPDAGLRRRSNWICWCRASRPPTGRAPGRRPGSGRPACGPTRRTGWRRCGPGSASTPTSARSRTRWAGSAVRPVHLDKGCYRGQETVARVHNLGKPPRMLVLLHLDGSADRPADRRSGAGRRPHGRPPRHRRRPRRSRARSRWRCSSAACPPTPTLTTGGEAEVAAVIDADSLPAHRRGRRRTAGRRTAAGPSAIERDAPRRAEQGAAQRAATGHGKVLAGQ